MTEMSLEERVARLEGLIEGLGLDGRVGRLERRIEALDAKLDRFREDLRARIDALDRSSSVP